MSIPINNSSSGRAGQRTQRSSRRYRVATLITVLAFATTTLSGCIWAPELARLRSDIEKQLPGVHFDQEFALTLGPISLGFAKLVTSFIPEAREARGYLKDLSHVQIAIYKVDSMPALGKLAMPSQLQKKRERGWELAVKVREENEVVWVMYRADERAVREVLVVVLDDEELVMVKARGRLERIIGRALMETNGHRGIPDFDDVFDTSF